MGISPAVTPIPVVKFVLFFFRLPVCGLLCELLPGHSPSVGVWKNWEVWFLWGGLGWSKLLGLQLSAAAANYPFIPPPVGVVDILTFCGVRRGHGVRSTMPYLPIKPKSMACQI